MLNSKLMCLPVRGRNIFKRFVATTTQLNNDGQKIEKSINQVTLMGRVGNDPQQRGNEEHPVVTFSLATNSNYRYESGDQLQRTDWHRISIFKPNLRTLTINFVKKGQRVYVQGRLSYGEVRSDDGQIRTASTIIADEIIFLQSKTATPESM